MRLVTGFTLYALVSLSFLVPLQTEAAEKQAKIVLSGPPAAVSFPLVHMQKTGALDSIVDNVEFKTWQSPDELRVLLLRKQADVLAVPTNVAANLFNKQQDVRLINVSAWGLLHIVSADDSVSSLEELKGQQIVVPFRGDMPDLIMKRLLSAADLTKHISIRYVATPLDAMSLLMARQESHVLLVEPAVSMILEKTSSLPYSVVAPSLTRAISIQQAWHDYVAGTDQIPQAGIAVTSASERSDAFRQQVTEAYANSLNWCQQNVNDCAELVAQHFDRLTKGAAAEAIKHSQLRAVNIEEARQPLQAFFEQLAGEDLAVIGGKMPSSDFYWLTE